MVLFECDWCRAIQKQGEVWILGIAAESVGMTAVRREINILSNWDDQRACHPLAVHFCSHEHKDKYMAALFETENLPATIIETETTVAPRRTAEQLYMRTARADSAATARKKKRVITKARRSA